MKVPNSQQLRDNWLAFAYESYLTDGARRLLNRGVKRTWNPSAKRPKEPAVSLSHQKSRNTHQNKTTHHQKVHPQKEKSSTIKQSAPHARKPNPPKAQAQKSQTPTQKAYLSNKHQLYPLFHLPQKKGL